MIRLYALFFRGYKSLFQDHNHRNTLTTSPGQAITEVLDHNATLLGDAYRGSGVLVGMLGALIILCAVAPFGFGIASHPVASVFGIAEVVLMLCVMLIMFHVLKRRDLKAQWLEARLQAEQERGKSLENIQEVSLEVLRQRVEPLLAEQIEYNHRNHVKYHVIEHAAERVTRVGFAISLLAAITHLFLHLDALILLTAALPAAVGALHGVNSFLRLEQLSEDHRRMAEQLQSGQVAFGKALALNNLPLAREVAMGIHELLVTGHYNWRQIASRLIVRVP